MAEPQLGIYVQVNFKWVEMSLPTEVVPCSYIYELKNVHRCKINVIINQRILSLFLIFLRQVLLKHNVGTGHKSPGDPERHDQLEEVVDDLDPAEDGEASEKAHCASYKT